MKAMMHLLRALRGTIAVCGTLLFTQATWAQTVEIESPAHDALMFEVDAADKWERAFNSIGVDLSVLSGSAGRA